MRDRDGLGAARRALLEFEVSSGKGTGGGGGEHRRRRPVVCKKGTKEKEIIKNRNRKIYNNDPDLDMCLPLTGSVCHVYLTMGPAYQKSC
jgi:hypothetical protein